MQMGSKEDESERFSHYIHKSFKKTASLIAYTCKAVALLSGANQSFQEAAFQYGRNLGIAFQLVDDLLDFVSSQAELGKPAAADLRLGLATAPVLFACEKFPDLNIMIMRRFSEPGDVEKAYEAVMKVFIKTNVSLLDVLSLFDVYPSERWFRSHPNSGPKTRGRSLTTRLLVFRFGRKTSAHCFD